MRWSCLLSLISAAFSLCSAKQNFILNGPKLYDKGTTESLALTFFDVEQKGQTHIRLLNQNGESILSEIAVDVENGQTKTIKLPVPSNIQDTRGKLQITGTIGNYSIDQTVDVGFRNPKTILFLNTDKPIYKSGQTVRIRVLATDSYLRPSNRTEEGQIWVTDPKKVRIAQWGNVLFSEGLVHREMPLPEEPSLGVWTVHVKIKNEKHTKRFEVLEYVLPPFEVNVTPPPYLLANARNATWRICAKYTYGKPVRGEIITKLKMKHRRHWSNLAPVIENRTEINGCKDVTLPINLLREGSSYYHNKQLQLQAEVTENGTGTKVKATGSAQFHKYPFKITLLTDDIEYFRPQIPLRITMSVTAPDSKPLPDEVIEICTDSVIIKQKKIQTLTCNINVCKKYTSDQRGFIIFTIPPQDPNTEYINIQARAAGLKPKYHSLSVPERSFKLKHWYSPSGSHLQLQRQPRFDCSAIGPDVKITQKFHYTYEKPGSQRFYYQVIARGDIIEHGDFEVSLQAVNESIVDDTFLPISRSVTCTEDVVQLDNAFKSAKYIGEFVYTIQLSHDMWPKARIVLYTITEGDLVADSTWYDIDPCFANKVEMKFGEEKQLPGSKATIHVKAEPRSLCSIGVVDKSIYVLNKGDILSGSQVSSHLSGLDTSRRTSPRQRTPDYLYCEKKGNHRIGFYHQNNYEDAITAFASAGGVVLTDFQLETRPCKTFPNVNKWYHSSFPNLDSPHHTVGHRIRPTIRHRIRPTYMMYLSATDFNRRPGIMPLSDEVNAVSLDDSSSVTVRTNFPDTWLFQLDRIGENGEIVMKKDMPDSITKWEGAAVCVHPKKGLGLSKTASIIAFQPFFASLTLPYSVIRNETVPVIVTVFNYLKDCLPIKIHLEQTEDFVLYNGTSTRDLCVCGEESSNKRFYVKPGKIGQMNITVRAETSNNQDICVNHDVATSVKISDTLTKPMIVEAEGFLKEEIINEYFCIEDAKYGLFKANHIFRVPEDAVSDSSRAYFSLTGDLLGPTVEGIDRLIRMPTGCGEQNMIGLVPNIVVLDYLNATGRLTENLRRKAVNNINQGYIRQKKYRHPDGSYSAFGTGDKEGSMWLTAFVVRTFTSAHRHIEEIGKSSLSMSKNWILSKQKKNGCFPMVGTVHHKAMKGGIAKDEEDTSALTAYIIISMLESGSVERSIVKRGLQCLEVKDNPSDYSLALFAYAASLANDPSSVHYLHLLMNNAIKEDASLYWKNDDASIAVETAAYAILSILKQTSNDTDGAVALNAAPIAKWLTMQRNPYGGFHSTQDTVIGLQALGEYAATLRQQEINMELLAKTDRIHENFQLNEDNKLIMQRINLRIEDEVETKVNIEARGSGCALAQIVLRYNLPNPKPSSDFELSVKAVKSEGNCKKAVIHICTSYNHENGSNMAIVEVKMASGYVPVKSTVHELLLNTDLEARRYEIKENNVNLYFITMTEKRKCFSFDVLQEIQVLDSKPAAAKVYDYYNNEKVVSVPYLIEETCLS